MSEGPQASGKPRGGFLNWALWGAALLGVAAVVYIIAQASTNQTTTAPAAKPAASAESSFASKLVLPEQPIPPPDYAFYDSAGKAMKVADLKGKVVVLNIWATWCAPCVAEMPTLARLQAAYPDKDVIVVPVSIDSAEAAAKARLFIARHEPLKFFHDREAKLPFRVNAPGAPTTIVYGRDGLEIARVAGEADWAGAEAKALIDKALAGA